MNLSEKTILISAGDPASIAPEITIKALKYLISKNYIKPVVVTNPKILENFINILKIDLQTNVIQDYKLFSDFKNNCINIIPLNIQNDVMFGKPNYKNASFVIDSIETCVRLLKNSIASAIVTNPINKNIMHKAGFKYNGHTDYLESLSIHKKKAVMMLVADSLKTVPLTIHVPLKEVPKLITRELIIDTIKVIIEDLKLYFGISKPRILVTGLNPHAGENGDIGLEEKEIILPALLEAQQKLNCSILGPVSADTAFTSDAREKHDVIVCMYHDQALIPIKTINFFNGVNVTLGIDFIRTSPDHGTAFEIAGSNKANAESLISSIELAYKMSILKKDWL